MLQPKSNSPQKKIYGIYLAIDYHPNADTIINKICKDLGIEADNGYGPDKEYKFHTTIIYSRFKIPKNKDDKLCNFETKVGSTIFQKKKPKISVPVKVIGFGFFDTPDGRNFHLKVDSPFLKSEFKRAVAAGLPTDFPDYTPHITIKNKVPDNFKVPNEIIQKYKGTVLYSNDEYIEELDKK